MYRYLKQRKSNLKGLKPKEGERLETKVERVIRNKEPIGDGSEPIYTSPDKGVLPEYDPRTDRWELATEAMDLIHRENKGSKIDPTNLTTSKEDRSLKVVKDDDNDDNQNSGEAS